MAAIQTEIYDAFISANADEQKARAAAESIARITTDYPKPEELVTKADLKAEMAKMETAMAKIEARIAELKAELMRALWLQGAGIIAIIISVNYLPK